MKPKYTIQALNDLYVVISDDMDPAAPSLTNGAAEAIKDLEFRLGGLGSRRVYYRDSVMRYDEMLHSGGQFTGFAPCKPAQQEFLLSLF